MLQVINVSRTYSRGEKTVSVLSGLSFEVDKPQMVAITGKSGAGKTTLLNIIAGIEAVDSGEVVVDGKALSSLTADERARMRLERIGIVHQSFHLLPQLTLWQNITLPGLLLERPRREVESRSSMLIETLQISAVAGRKPDQVSGGELQRAAIARALCNSPAIVLADEPTGNLDEETATRSIELLRQMVDDFNLLLLLVTHDKDIAALADSHFMLEKGSLKCLRS